MAVLFNLSEKFMRKILLATILSFIGFNASSQFFPGVAQGYQAFLQNGNSHIIVQEDTLTECQTAVSAALANNYTVISSCR